MSARKNKISNLSFEKKVPRVQVCWEWRPNQQRPNSHCMRAGHSLRDSQPCDGQLWAMQYTSDRIQSHTVPVGACTKRVSHRLMLRHASLVFLTCATMTNTRSCRRGSVICIHVSKCIRSFSASTEAVRQNKKACI